MFEYNIEGALIFQSTKYRIIYREKEILLSQKETEVLQLLCNKSMQVVERKKFIQEIWGNRDGANVNLNKNILTLRRKFESLGHLNAINTVPRVGYMLRLNSYIIDTIVEEHEVTCEQSDLVSTRQEEKETKASRYKYNLPYLNLALILAGLLSVLSYYLYTLYIEKGTVPLTYKVVHETPSSTIIEIADFKQSVNYNSFISRLPIDKQMIVSLSNSAVSFFDYSNGKTSRVKVFLVDLKENTNKQLSCIADYINEKSTFIYDEGAKVIYPHSSLERASSLQIKQYYTPCLSGTSRHIGDISTILTPYSRTLPKGDQPSSWLQNISFLDSKNNIIFDFQMVFRANYLDDENDKNKKNYLVDLSQRSMKIKKIDQSKITKNKYLKMIFNEYESDHILLRILSPINNNGVTIISSIFSGTLSHRLTNKN